MRTIKAQIRLCFSCSLICAFGIRFLEGLIDAGRSSGTGVPSASRSSGIVCQVYRVLVDLVV